MTAQISLSHDYTASAKDVWRVATDFAALAEVCRPLITFEGLPEGRCEAGQHLSVGVRLFGLLPAQDYQMEVVAQDDVAMTLQSAEHGAGVKSWRHHLTVTPTETGARLTDTIDIDAGPLTPLFAWWGRKLYAHRHKGRLRLLAENTPD
ncbi:SRPBCC family protein [Tateyamaria sp. ANG-S1]|uniref:SRPBCC family protein n=1 Tax=Tateyamaria sp. ANG-S1 TaxID=1577905 RepID=UPI00068ED21F|nr:SRPBCC family protein [Tateyamaria sp. ANG-S1]